MSAPASERTTGRVAVVGLLVAVAVALTAFTHRSGVDAAWRAWVIDQRSGTLDPVFTAVSNLGSSLVLVPVTVVLALLLATRGHRQDALLLTVTTLGAVVLGPLLKIVVERPRPDRGHLVTVDSWAYPSGHSLTSMAVLGVLVVLAGRHLPTRPARRIAAATGVVLVAAIGLSRVYLGVHWPTDVLAGWLVGAIWLVLCLVLLGRCGGHARAR